MHYFWIKKFTIFFDFPDHLNRYFAPNLVLKHFQKLKITSRTAETTKYLLIIMTFGFMGGR